MSFRSLLLYLAIAVFLLFSGVYLVQFFGLISGYGAVGTNDFIEYWASFQLFLTNKNPYDPLSLNIVERSLGRDLPTPLMMWNPPWTVVLMSPILALPFPQAAAAWLLTNILLLFTGAILVWFSFGNTSKPPIPVLFAACFFFPVWNCISLGQVSIFITFGGLLFLWAVSKEKDHIAGLALIFFTIKPHLGYIFVIVALWWIFKTKRYSILCSAVLGFLSLLALTLYIAPSSITHWINASLHPPDPSLATRVGDWQVATGTGALRSPISNFTGDYPAWPMILVPLIVVVGCSIVLLVKQPTIDWHRDLPTLLCISLFTSPFGWLFDHSLLIVSQIILACTVRSRASLYAMMLLQLLVVFAHQIGYNAHHHYFWFPLAIFIIWLHFLREKSSYDPRL